MVHPKQIVASLFVALFFMRLSAFAQDISDPSWSNPDLAMGIKDLKAENYEEAIESFQKARKAEPSSSLAAYYLGITYKIVQEYQEAIVHLTAALTLEPGVKDARLDLAEVYYNLELNEDALKQLKFAEEQGVKPANTAFLKGLVLLKLDRPDAAMDAFKKAKELDASLAQAANFQIGVALVKVGEREKAGQMFKEVVVADPNSDMAQFANQYLAALTRRPEEAKPFNLTLNVKWEYDDNVILKPSDQTVAGGITGEDDTRYVGILRAEYTPFVSGPFNIKTQYSIYYNDYQKLGSYDVMSHTLAVVPGYTMTDSMINILLGYNYTWVDDDEYQRTGTVSPGYTFIPFPGQMAQIAIRWQRKELLKPPFMRDEDRDAQEYAASAGWFYFFAGDKGFINLRYELNKEDTDGINWGYVGNKGNLNLILPLDDSIRFNVSGEAYYQQFEHTNTNFLKKRRDMTYTGSAMLAYEFLKNLEIQLQYAYIRGDSNTAVYDYHKNITSVGIEVKF